ncbi:MAG: helix-turn-helix domain-containing protein [Shimia sp.]|nr:helix-turn-helix domain-containing protein [Shimia sp.]
MKTGKARAPQLIRAHLDRCGLTQRELASSTGCSDASVSMWLGGGSVPRGPARARLAKKTGLDGIAEKAAWVGEEVASARKEPDTLAILKRIMLGERLNRPRNADTFTLTDGTKGTLDQFERIRDFLTPEEPVDGATQSYRWRG